MPEGRYELGGLPVTVHNGEARLENGSLAGSTLTMDRAVRNMMFATGMNLDQGMADGLAQPGNEHQLRWTRVTFAWAWTPTWW